ncbi:MAG: ribonuclease III [Oscillospiraceae bacterium]|nr:ribonuclease III [Candidatus Equicaccousia limihippi]
MEFGYEFKDGSLLETALSHSSYANEHHVQSNERLEFLGDSVLSIIVSDYIYEKFPDVSEGELTKIRAALVCESALSDFGREIKLNEMIKLGKGEMSTGGAQRNSIISDAFEAVLAAIYLDSGMESAREFVMRFVKEHLGDSSFKDYKTALQEVIQKNPEEKLGYFLIGEEGPEHDKSFTVEVRLNSNIIGTGTGHSKKAAEQQAAKTALELMGVKL